MAFWSLAYTRKWVDINQLRQAVKTDSNPYGQITPEQFQTITGEEFA